MALPSGIFLTYRDFSIQQQILIWAAYNGTITREDTLDLNNIAFVYNEGENVTLVEYNPHWVDQTIVIDATLRPFAADGTPLTPEPLYSETLADNIVASGSAFTWADGELRMLIATMELNSTPTTYALRLISHTAGSTVVHEPFNPGPLSPNHYATYWTLAVAPWGQSVVGFVVAQQGGDQQVWVEGIAPDGQSTSLVHIENMPPNEAANKTAVVVYSNTVYAIYTTQTLVDNDPGGAYLVAFPQDEILASDDRPVLQPSSFMLSAYPNPFNATVRLDYSVAAAGPVTLTVFDLRGREVTKLAAGMMTAGRHSASWNAGDLPSGLYLARLTAGNVSQVRKLVLLK